LLPSDIAHAWPLATGDLLTVLGLALLVPLPRFTLVAVMAVARRAVRQLAVPAALGLCVVLVVHAINGSTLPATVRVALLICWWAALTVGTVQICRVVAGLEADAVVPPGPSRLRAGIWVLAVALAIPASVLVGSSALAGRILPALAGAGLLLLTLILGCTLRDLRQVPVAD
jgi:hypothetical protein